jgi:hypothetical protein
VIAGGCGLDAIVYGSSNDVQSQLRHHFALATTPPANVPASMGQTAST